MTRNLRKNAVLIVILGISVIFGVGNVCAAEPAAKTVIPLSGTSWDVAGKASLTYTIPHHKSTTDVANESSTITFSLGGVFSSDLFTGTWTQKENNYTLNVTQSVISYIEKFLSGYGVKGTPKLKSITVGGTVSSTKSSEKITLVSNVKGTIAVTSPEVLTVPFSTSIILSGTPSTSARGCLADEDDIPQSLTDLFNNMLDDIVGSINEDQ